MNKIASEKLNVLLIGLIFIIPLIAINCCYYCISNINFQRAKKEQEINAIHEVETLSSEANFSNGFSSLFGDYFNSLKIIINNNNDKNSNLTEQLSKEAEKVFEKPFPDYNLFVFKTDSKKKSTELLFSQGNIGVSRKALCFAFEYLYNYNNSDKNKNSDFKSKESFAKNLLGEFTNAEIIAKEMRGITTFSNGVHKNSWFIWNYFVRENNEVYGVILLCDVKNNHHEIGRLLALKKLRDRGQATGAFIPLLSDYGKPIIPSPLDKSRIFNDFVKELTVKDVNDLEKWLKDTLPNGQNLGNYTVFCNLERGSTHIAIILVKSIKKFYSLKWLIAINILLLLIMVIILFCGIGFNKWPQIKLTTRFAFSYLLASFLPLSLLGVVSYGYLKQYENTSINQAKSDLLSALKSFDAQKNVSVKEYREAFSKALNDKTLIELIKEKGVNDQLVVQRVLEIFENNNLPLLGVKITDIYGEGPFIKGNAFKDFDFESYVKSFLSIQVDLLKNKIPKDSQNSKQGNETYVKDDKNDLANKGYKAILGRDVGTDVAKRLSEPILSKNGDFTSYQIYDVLKIDGKPKYMLFVAWDDKTLDKEIISKSINSYYEKNIKKSIYSEKNKHTFLAFKIKGQDLEDIGETTRHASQNLFKEIKKHAKLVSLTKKNDTFEENDNIVVIMPALNFNQTIFVGWKSKTDILIDLMNREKTLIILVLLSFIILRICIINSASTFLKPISALKGALDEVSKGNLNVGFKNAPNDELGNLSEEFSKMINGLEEKERLSKLISDQAVQAIQKNSSGLSNDTETFKGVALVSDIRNFTGMSEKYDPVIITELLNEHFAEMAKIISDKGGLIYKFIGDAIEVVFPEKDEYEEPASERAFKAGSMMIAKLAEINIRRKNKDLFTYRIGVGLCYGTMYSGTVGSLETRLDYSIIGDPLKNAAKLEALSIQNPDFPIVVCEYIAEKMACLGLKLKKIDKKSLNFSVYTLYKDVNENNKNYLHDIENTSKIKEEAIKNKKEKERQFFSLFVDSQIKDDYKKLSFNILFIIFIASFVTFCAGFIFTNKYNKLKFESEKECLRLSEQMQSNEVMKSCFNILCFEFYENIDNALKSENKTHSFKQKILNIAEKYENLGYPIPKYWCCLYDGYNIKEEGTIAKGFSQETCNKIKNYAFVLKNEKDTKKQKDEYIQKLLGSSTKFYDMRTTLFRRSSMATIANEKEEDLLIDTNKFFDKKHKELISYIMCGMPKDIVESPSPKYYTLLAGNSIQLAIKDKDKWYFSKGFSENDKNILRKSPNSPYILDKGYFIEDIDINNKKYTIYAISSKLSFTYYPISKICFYVFFSILLLGSFILFVQNKILFSKSTLSVKLSQDILLSALLPILIVSFVFYLFINEDYDVEKSEVRMKLNNLINDIESRELYYHPLTEKYLNSLSTSNIFRKYINLINNSKSTSEKDENTKNFRNYLKNQIIGYGDRNFNIDFITNNSNVIENEKSKIEIDPHYRITEMLVIGKNNWAISINYREEREDKENNNNNNDDENNKLTDFGKILHPLFSEIYFKNQNTKKTNFSTNINTNESSANKNNASNTFASTKNELVIDELLKAFNSIFGKEFVFKLINFPNNLVSVIISYSIASIQVSTVYSEENPNNIDAIIFSLLFYDNELKPSICKMRNAKEPFKQHLYSGSNTDHLYCFHSPNIDVGVYFFYSTPDENDDNFFPSKLEDLKAVKEFCFISSYINSSYIPVSTTVNLYGNHLLEARQGNIVKDNVYIALGSEKPLTKNSQNYIYIAIFIILISILIIYLIAQTVIYDLLSPIKRLLEGAKSAAQGKYNYKINFSRVDELGVLCSSFDKMMKGLEEKQLMNRMVSRTALKVTSNLEETQSKKEDVLLLYISIPNFDKIMNNTPPFELFKKLREQIALISKTIIDNGGDIDKIMGEKLLIAFHVNNNSFEELASKVSRVAHFIATNDKLGFNVSVGVNCGQVISGYLGVGQKQDFTIIGDPVNVTARIDSLAEKLETNRCLVSENIYRFIKSNVQTKLFGEVELKGKSEPMKVYQLL